MLLNYCNNTEFWSWINEHIDDDPIKLRLKWHGKMPWIDMAILQIECRRKARKKLKDELVYPTFFFPTALSAEQCTGDTLAEFHSSLLTPGITLLDLTSGLGIDAYHAARKTQMVTAIDVNPEITEAVAHNAEVLGLTNIVAVNADCQKYIRTTDRRFDVVFIDPARRGKNGERIYRLSDCSPDVVTMLPDIASIAKRLIVKASPMLDITQVLRELPDTTDIYVTGSSTECKEIIADMTFGIETKTEPAIHAITPLYNISFTQSEEAASLPLYGKPESGGYLYEPGATVMKAGPFKLLSQRYGVAKLHPNTHLYYSSTLVSDFPGDAWLIDRIANFSSHEIKSIVKSYERLNIAVRNLDIPADALRKKLKVKDGGETRLIATTLDDNSKVMLILSPVKI